MKIGFSKDVHRLKKNVPLILGGVTIPYKKGLISHSDGDVVLHSLIDAILGALNKGDIGKVFPDNTSEYKNASSMYLLSKTYKILENCNVFIDYIDIFISCDEPKLSPFTNLMKFNISETLQISKDRISIKCGTNEGLGYIGQKKAIESYCVVILKESDKNE